MQRKSRKVRLIIVSEHVHVASSRPSITGVAAYGASNASTSARMLAWFDLLGATNVDIRLWGSQPDNSPRTTIRHPIQIARAELSLRRWARWRSSAGTLLIQREASPFSDGSVEERILRQADRGILDLDDALTTKTPGGLIQRAFPRHHRVRRAAVAADRIVAGNAFIADLVSDCCDDVVIVPTCVDLADYDRKSDYRIHDAPTIGWIGTTSTEPYLLDIAESLRQVCLRTGGTVELLSSTSGPPPHALHGFARRVKWTPLEQSRRLAKWDVAVMPLRTTDWERGKCAYKLLQYGAVGLPAVATPVGVNIEVLRETSCPRPISIDDWTSSLLEVLDGSAETRRAAGTSLYGVVSNGFTFSSWREVMAKCLGIG